MTEEFAKLGSACGVEGTQNGEGVHPLDEVVARGLAELLVGCDHVENVVDDLECHAVRVAEFGDCFDVRTRDGPGDAPDAARRREQ